MKTCNKCNEEKPFEDFYRDKAKKDGHNYTCKVCSNAANKKRTQANPELKAAYCKKWNQANPDKVSVFKAKYKIRNPLKIKARSVVNNAIQSGKLIKPTKCEACDTEVALDGHHIDYSKPLEVMWLCHPCHMAWHLIHGTDLNNETININTI